MSLKYIFPSSGEVVKMLNKNTPVLRIHIYCHNPWNSMKVPSFTKII